MKRNQNIPHTCARAWGMAPIYPTAGAARNALKPVRAELKRHHMRLVHDTGFRPGWMRPPYMNTPRWKLMRGRGKHLRLLHEGTLQECCQRAVEIILQQPQPVTSEVSDAVSQD